MNTIRHFHNAMRRYQTPHAATRLGLLTSYDPNQYCAKVALQPNNVETGWLPIVSPWVGNGWGLFAPPNMGDLVEVQFQEGDVETGFICQRFFNDSDRPLPVPCGEFWLVHQSGSTLQFKNNGDVIIHAANTIQSKAVEWQHTGKFTVTGDALIHGECAVTGNLKSDGDITDQSGKQSMAAMRAIYNSHHHGDTPTPNEKMQ